MLESMRQKGASIFIYLIFGLLILIFVINFAPNAGQSGGGCAGAGNTAITINGEKVNNNAFKISYSIQDEGKTRDRIHNALDFLIRREILAQAAEERGLRVDRDAIDEEIKKGYFFYGGFRARMPVFEEAGDGTRTWSYSRFRGWVRNLDVSLNTYQDEQARGLQATMMAELLAGSARVSRDEAMQEYLFENTTVTYDTVAFSPDAYRDAMRLADADIQRFLAGHEEEVKAKYKAEEVTYKGTKPQLHLRQIFIAKAEPAATDKPAETKPDDKKPDKAAGGPKPAGMSIDEAFAKLEATRAQIESGKLKFGEAVKQLSTDEAQKAREGDMGWHKVEAPELAEKAVNDAVKALQFKPGVMTPVIKGENGVYLVVAEAERKGDLTYDQVKMEIAAELAKQTWGKEAAKRAALDALAQAQAGKGKNLDEMFKRDMPEMPPMGSGTQQLTPEMLEAIKKMQEQGQLPPPPPPAGSAAPGSAAPAGSAAPGSAAPAGSAEKTGWIEIPLVGVRDSLAGSKAQADGATGGSSAPAGSAKPAAPAGSAKPAPAAGSAAGSGSAAPPATTPAAGAPATPATTTTNAITPSKDQLPAFGTVEQPQVRTEGPLPRYPQLPGVGKDVGVLFDELQPGQLAPRVFEDSTGAYVLVQLQTKGKPEDFDKVADVEMAKLREARGQALVRAFVRERCEALLKAEKIRPAAEKITETDDKGNQLPSTYRPCATFR